MVVGSENTPDRGLGRGGQRSRPKCGGFGNGIILFHFLSFFLSFYYYFSFRDAPQGPEDAFAIDRLVAGFFFSHG